VGFAVKKMLLGQVFLRAPPISLSVSFYPCSILIFDSSVTDTIQGDLGGKVNIFGGNSICHRKKKVHMNMCLILYGYRDRDVKISRLNSLRIFLWFG
jgi:hypothetical protein